MLRRKQSTPGPGRFLTDRNAVYLWVAGLWVAPLWVLAVLVLHPPLRTEAVLAVCGFALSPVPALLGLGRRSAAVRAEGERNREEAEQLRLELQNLKYRTAQLRSELSAADQQARLSHQLTILGQFTAGFLHEFNNPLAVLTNRIEILLDERRNDAALCADLEQMLKDAHYMTRIGSTLLPALQRQRTDETFSPCIPAEALEEALASLGPLTSQDGIALVFEPAETPQVNLPAHVVSEVARALVTNAIQALAGRNGGTVWVRLEPYHAAGASVVFRVEDNGPGVPEGVHDHIFEPFVSRGANRERLGLGLFLAASLMKIHDGSLRYEPRTGGGARFIVELPPARFTKGQPYHWFLKGVSE